MAVPNAGFRPFLWQAVATLLLATSARGTTVQAPNSKESIQVWDTASHLTDQVDVRDRDGWAPIPSGADKDYRPGGDLVVENEYLTAVFSAKLGRVILYSQPSGKRRIELAPLQLKGKPAAITSCKLVRKLDDRAVVDVRFSGAGMNLSAILSFANGPIVEVEPDENTKGISLSGPIEVAVVPGFIGDDLVFDPEHFPSAEALHIPTDYVLVGLLSGEDGMLVATWPEQTQEVTPILKKNKTESRVFESMQIENGGGRIHFAVLDGPGTWHGEALKPSYLEKDVSIDWRRPFPAKWKTQLLEDGVKTTYGFRDSKKKRFWRGGVGTYTYPVWCNGDSAFFHLGKKIPPKGESLVYFLERANDTPKRIFAPADIVKQTIRNDAYERMLDFEGRKLTSDSRPDPCVGTATCGVTDKFKPIFESGKEVEERETIEGGIEDMIYHLSVLTERVHAYQDFAHDTKAYLAAVKRERPQLTSYLEEMEEVVGELIAAYNAQKENIKTLTYAEELGRKTVALAREKRSDNLAAFLKLKGKWTGMGGSLEGLNRKLNTTARKLSQRAGYGCVEQLEAVEIAKEIRRRVKKQLRNPNSYEIWSYD